MGYFSGQQHFPYLLKLLRKHTRCAPWQSPGLILLRPVSQKLWVTQTAEGAGKDGAVRMGCVCVWGGGCVCGCWGATFYLRYTALPHVLRVNLLFPALSGQWQATSSPRQADDSSRWLPWLCCNYKNTEQTQYINNSFILDLICNILWFSHSLQRQRGYCLFVQMVRSSLKKWFWYFEKYAYWPLVYLTRDDHCHSLQSPTWSWSEEELRYLKYQILLFITCETQSIKERSCGFIIIRQTFCCGAAWMNPETWKSVSITALPLSQSLWIFG